MNKFSSRTFFNLGSVYDIYNTVGFKYHTSPNSNDPKQPGLIFKQLLENQTTVSDIGTKATINN